MPADFLRLRSPALDHHRDLMLLRAEGGIAVDALGWIERQGLVGQTVLVMPEGSLAGQWSSRPLAEVAAALDAAQPERSDPFPVIREEFPDHLLRAALFKEAPPNGYDASQFKELRSFLKLHITKPARETLELFGMQDITDSVMSRLAVLSAGDPEARRQALLSFPLSRFLVLRSPEALDLIDARAPLLPWIAKSYDLDPAALRRFSTIESRIGAQLRGDKGKETLASLRVARVDNAELAVQAAKAVSAAQIPEDVGGIAKMLWAFRVANEISSRIQMSFAPFQRLLRRVGVDDWEKAGNALSEQIAPQECKDYLDAASKVLSTSLLLRVLKDQPGIDMKRLASSAEKLWKKDTLAAEDATYLNRFLDGMERARYPLMSGLQGAVRSVLSEAMTLKDLRELQTRWHHVRGTFDHKVMATSEPVSWAPLVGHFDLAEGVSARELASSTDLEAQGDQERHCVSGYASVVLAGRRGGASVIFSLEREGKTLSTVEIKIQLEETRRRQFEVSAVVVQNKAKRNATPCVAAQHSGRRLASEIRDLPVSQIQAYLQGVESNGATLKERLDRAILSFGVNITNPQMAEIAVDTYREVFPKSLRDKPLQAWLDVIVEHGGADMVGLGRHVETLASALAELSPAPQPDADEPLEAAL